MSRVVFLLFCFFGCFLSSNAAVHTNDSELVGYDSDGGRYIIKVSETTEKTLGKHDLHKVDGVYYTVQNDIITFTSNSGVLDVEKDLLHLIGDVVVVYNSEYDVKTKKISFDFKKSIFFNKTHTIISGLGRKLISNSGFINHIDKKLINFFGPIESEFVR